MELPQVEAFLEAARAGSFRSAAKNLNLTQPSLSSRIHALEAELNVPLFHRMGRGVRLTEMGKAFLPFAERAVDALGQGRDAVVAASHAAGGVLNIASARTIGTYTLPGILEQFRASYPDIAVHIRTGRSSDVLQMVLSEEAHFGLSRALNNPDILTIHLYDEEVVLVTHPDHPFAKKGKASINEVAREPLILYDPGSTYFLLIYEVCREAGIVPKVEMNLDSIEATKQMVALNLGVSFLPMSAIRREIEFGALRHIPLEGEHRVVLPTCVLMRRSQYYSPAVLAFLKVLHRIYSADIANLKEAVAP